MSTIAYDTSLEMLRVSFENVKPSLTHLLNQYLSYAKNVLEYADTTLDQRRTYLKQFHDYMNSEEMDLHALTNEDLDLYFAFLSKRGHMRFPDRKISTRTVNTSKRSIKGFLNWCIYKNIPIEVKLQGIREKKASDDYPNILRHDDILYVIKHIKNRQDKLIVSVMYETGIRIQELVDMKIEHLRGTTLDVVGKGKKHRITYLSPALASEIYAWVEDNGWSEGHVFRPLMHGREGMGYTGTDTIRQRIEKLFKQILNVNMSPHKLRHAFALKLLKDGVSLRAIQKLLGHSKIETTMTYLNIDNSYLESEYSRSFSQTVYA